jgi:flagellar hook-length control protein FliK
MLNNVKSHLNKDQQMQNLTLQVAKPAPARQQMANQDNVANGAADSAVNGAPNPFAEMLKKQVKQKEANANGNSDEMPTKQANAAPTKAGAEVPAEKTNVELRVSALDEKSKAEAQTEATPAPIQDVILMQMGLQPATQINSNQPATIAGEQVEGEVAVTSDIETQQAKTGIEKSPALTSGTPPTADAAGNKVDTKDQSFVKQLGANMASQHADITDKARASGDVAGKQELMQNPALAVESNSKELDTKAIQAQMNTAAIAQQAPTKAVEVTSAAAAMAANEIPTPFGKPDWSQAVNQKVVWMVGKGEQSATLTLNPPDMGPLKVVIQVDNDQVDTTFISDNPEVRQALQDGMQMLRDKMQDTGMQLGNAQVSSQAQSQRHFEQAMQQRAQERLEQSTKDTPDSAPATPVIQRVSNGLVDTFA